jgi:hypothetical protein
LSSNLEIKNAELEAVASQLQDLTTRSEGLSAELASGVSTHDTLLARYQKLELEFSNLKSSSGIFENLIFLDRSDRQEDEVNVQLAEKAALCKSLQSRIEILDADVSSFSEERLELSSRVLSIQTMHDMLKEVNKVQSTKIIDAESEHKKELEEERLNSVAAKSLSVKIEQLESQLSIAESIVATLHQNEVADSSKEVPVSTSRSIAPIAAKLHSSIETQTTSSSSDSSGTQTELLPSSDSAGTQTLTSSLDSSGTQTENLSPSITSSTQTELDESRSSGPHNGGELKESISLLEKNLSTAKSSKQKYKTLVSDLQSRIMELKEYITSLESQALEHTSKITSTEALLSSVQELANEVIMHRSISLDSEKEAFVIEINEWRMENSLLLKQVDVLMSEKSIMTADYTQTVSDLEEQVELYKMKAELYEVDHRRMSTTSYESRDYNLEIQQQKSLLARKESEVRLLRDLAEELTSKVNKLEIQLRRNSSLHESPMRAGDPVDADGVGSLRRKMSQILPEIKFSELQVSPTRVTPDVSSSSMPKSDTSNLTAKIEMLEIKIRKLVEHISAANAEVDEVIKENNLLRSRLSILIERRKRGWWKRFQKNFKKDLEEVAK